MDTNYRFNVVLEDVLTEAFRDPYKAAVGVVQYKNKFLLGLSTANDDRHNKWCFPGGHVKSGEMSCCAVEREVREETGVKCKHNGEGIVLKNKPSVVFYHCKASSSKPLKPNSEFTALGWFTKAQLKGLKLYPNVKQLLSMIK